MRINCFGCSHTHDLYPKESSWPKELSKMYPQHIVYNYSLPGSSALWSLFCIRQAEKHPGDINIFQSTSSNRVTVWNANPLNHKMINDNNYFKLDHKRFKAEDSVKYVTPSIRDYSEFKRQYYDFITRDTSEFLHQELLKISISLADYSFAQLDSYDLGHDCFIDEIGNKRYRKLVCDGKGQHLGAEGAKVQAEWIAEKLGDKLNVE